MHRLVAWEWAGDKDCAHYDRLHIGQRLQAFRVACAQFLEQLAATRPQRADAPSPTGLDDDGELEAQFRRREAQFRALRKQLRRARRPSSLGEDTLEESACTGGSSSEPTRLEEPEVEPATGRRLFGPCLRLRTREGAADAFLKTCGRWFPQVQALGGEHP